MSRRPAEFHAAGRLLQKIAAQFDERRVCLSLIHAAERDGRPYDLSSLAASVGQSRPTLSRLITALVRAGEVRQIVDPQDRRRMLLHLTEAGRSVARRQLGLLDDLMQQAERERSEANAFLIKPVKAREIDPAEALPYIRELYDWSQSSPDSIPFNLLHRLLVVSPDLNVVGRSQVHHWGNMVPSGGRALPSNSFDLHSVISRRSQDYFSILGAHFSAGLRKPVLHQVEIDWDGPGAVYQRICIPHPAFGMMLSTRYLDFDYDKLARRM